MKFAKLTSPDGSAAVYVHPSMIILPGGGASGHNTTIRTQMGNQDVREAPDVVAKAMESVE